MSELAADTAEQCGNCQCFRVRHSSTAAQMRGWATGAGVCRRDPTPVEKEPFDWCASFKAKSPAPAKQNGGT